MWILKKMTFAEIGMRFLRALGFGFGPSLPPPGGRRSGVPDYFMEPSWARRSETFLDSLTSPMGPGFANANAKRIAAHLLATGARAKIHVVFNLGTNALLAYLRSGDYKNAYQGPVVNGKKRAASATRRKVDRLIGLSPPENFYFCALAMGGTGIRFYGEYCAVLASPADEQSVRRVLDRNSYELICSPMKEHLKRVGHAGQDEFIHRLGAQFRSKDCGHMIAIKVMQLENPSTRLLTEATIGAAVIRDEDYVEAYHEGAIKLVTLLELRERSEEQFTEMSITTRWAGGQRVAIEEMLWLARREEVRVAAAAANIPIRIANDSGRTMRWR